jgi:F-type H+-transporting ATPase subunit b
MVLIVALLGWLAAPALRAAEAPAAEGAHAAHAEVSVHEGGEGEHGKEYPLLPTGSKSDALQALWVLIIFFALLVTLYLTAWKNVLAGLKAREQGIRQNIAEAEAARKKAEATLKEYNAQLATAEGKIRDMMAKASADAEKLATNLRMQAQQDSEEIKERASRDIEAARKAAVTDIYAQAAELSTTIAEKILRRNLNANDQRDLVNQSLEQLQGAGKM